MVPDVHTIIGMPISRYIASLRAQVSNLYLPITESDSDIIFQAVETVALACIMTHGGLDSETGEIIDGPLSEEAARDLMMSRSRIFVTNLDISAVILHLDSFTHTAMDKYVHGMREAALVHIALTGEVVATYAQTREPIEYDEEDEGEEV